MKTTKRHIGHELFFAIDIYPYEK